ncbi:MAG: hypothetical protein J7575_05080, partial [Chloroflexi bacterium]|nr:hypothetical protein [Chloroflexota bacterium]
MGTSYRKKGVNQYKTTKDTKEHEEPASFRAFRAFRAYCTGFPSAGKFHVESAAKRSFHRRDAEYAEQFFGIRHEFHELARILFLFIR